MLIRVTSYDFDPIEQARSWRELGPAEAIAQLEAKLRVVRLLGHKICLDRNQILDGIIVLAMGPCGVLEALSEHVDAPNSLIVRIAGTDDKWPESREQSVWRQLAAVEELDWQGWSSARYALDSDGTSSQDWLYGEPTQMKAEKRYFGDKIHCVPAALDLDSKREQWVTALRAGKFEIEHWVSPGQRAIWRGRLSQLVRLELPVQDLLSRVLKLEAEVQVNSNGPLQRSRVIALMDRITDESALKRVVYDWWDRQRQERNARENGLRVIRFTLRSEGAYAGYMSSARALGLVTETVGRRSRVRNDEFHRVSYMVLGGVVDAMRITRGESYRALTVSVRSKIENVWKLADGRQASKAAREIAYEVSKRVMSVGERTHAMWVLSIQILLAIMAAFLAIYKSLGVSWVPGWLLVAFTVITAVAVVAPIVRTWWRSSTWGVRTVLCLEEDYEA